MIFSKKQKLASAPVDGAALANQEEPAASLPEQENDLRQYDEEGYDERGFDRDGYSRNGYDAKGYGRDIGKPLDPSGKTEEEILKYRRADGYFEYELAVYANYPDLKENFEANHEDIAELIYNLFLIDEGYALRLWSWLLNVFESTLGAPANSYRLISGVVHSLVRDGILLERLLPCLQKNDGLCKYLFGYSSHLDRIYAVILAACITERKYDFLCSLMDILLSNPHLGIAETPAADELLKWVIEELSPPAMTREGFDALTKYIKKSTKILMRKVLFKLLDQKMEYLLKEEKRKQAEAERAARLEQQRLRLEEERQGREKETDSRQKMRTSKKKYAELKNAAITQNRQEPARDGGRFIDFQQLEGTMVAMKAHPEIPDCLLPGDRLELRREPYYLQDPMAISVMDTEGMKIGYISNHSNTFLALLMDEGRELFGRLYSIGGEETGSLQICVELFLVE